MDTAQARFLAFKARLEEKIIGQSPLIEKLLIAVLTGGHVLLEGPPGLAKTTAVKALAEGIHAQFQRIQFTPDLMPADLTGSEIFNPDTRQFDFVKGPIFNQIILADEINRAPPKIQSALLEAMQEYQVTTNGVTRSLPDLFLVLATQNPLEQSGTYPLPEAQLDRFLLHVQLDYPNIENELKILDLDSNNYRQSFTKNNILEEDKNLTIEEVFEARERIANTHIEPALKQYIVETVNATRQIETINKEFKGVIDYGASPRASIALYKAASATAYLNRRDYVIPEDIQAVAHDVLRHRIMLNYSAQSKGLSKDNIINAIISTIPVP